MVIPKRKKLVRKKALVARGIKQRKDTRIAFGDNSRVSAEKYAEKIVRDFQKINIKNAQPEVRRQNQLLRFKQMIKEYPPAQQKYLIETFRKMQLRKI